MRTCRAVGTVVGLIVTIGNAAACRQPVADESPGGGQSRTIPDQDSPAFGDSGRSGIFAGDGASLNSAANTAAVAGMCRGARACAIANFPYRDF